MKRPISANTKTEELSAVDLCLSVGSLTLQSLPCERCNFVLQMSEAEQLAWDSSVQVLNGLDPLNSARDHCYRAAFMHPPD